MKCPKCQFDNLKSAKFCNECGNKLETYCLKCEKVNPFGSKFCNECGYDIGKPTESPPIDFDKPQSYTPKFLADKILTTRGYIEGERKVVTVLSADIAQSTSIFEKLDPEDVHSIMDSFFKIAMEEIHRYEGTINQFLGDGFMAIFGAPVAHEDDTLRACNAALAIQTEMSAYGEKLEKKYGIDFRVRIGLNTGKVVVGSIGNDLRMDYTAVGDTTNIAFLLQQIAEPGQIILSDGSYRNIKGYFSCEWLGEEKLKHRKKPVKFCELHHGLTKKSRLDLEEEETLSLFVNRDQELSMLLDLYERVKKNQGQVICINGEAGEGKSRLIYEFRKRIDPAESLYLESQCISYGKNFPYYPVVEILKNSFDISEFDSQEKIRGILESKINNLDKKLIDSAPTLFKLLSLEKVVASNTISDPKQAKEATFQALRSFIFSGIKEKPLIMVIENLQWMDSASEEFISYIVENIASFPVFLILTYRVIYTHPFGSKSYLRQISLSPLSTGECKSMIENITPKHRLPDDFIQLVLDKSEGNPLYLEEIIKSLMERGIILKGAMGYKLSKDIKEIEIPESIQEIILARIDRLEKYSKITIQTASVIGREFTLKLLARKEELERQLESHMTELKHLELVREKSFFPEIEYIFKSAVTKDVIYDSLLIKHRKDIHRKIAESIEKLYAEKTDDYLEMLAYHYFNSDSIDKSIFYLVKAGEKASSIYANNEAIGYFHKALNLMDQHHDSWNEYLKEAHQKLAGLYDLIGDFPQAIHHYMEGMKYAKSSIEKVENMRQIGRICEKTGNLSEALKFYEEALDLIDRNEFILETGRIYMNIGWIHNRNGDYDNALDSCNRALSIFRQKKCDYETALALNNLAVIYEFQGQWNLTEKCNKESIQLMKKIGDQRKLGSFYISLGLLKWKKGELKKSKNYFKKSFMHMETINHIPGMANASLHLGRVYGSEGNIDKAFPYLEKSLEMFQKIGIKAKLCQNYIGLAEANVKKGALKKAMDYCQKGMEIAIDDPYPFDQGKIHFLLGEIKRIEGEDAEKDLIKSMDIFSSIGRKYEFAVSMEKLGNLKIDKDQKKEGEKYVNDARAIFKKLGVKGY